MDNSRGYLQFNIRVRKVYNKKEAIRAHTIKIYNIKYTVSLAKIQRSRRGLIKYIKIQYNTQLQLAFLS